MVTETKSVFRMYKLFKYSDLACYCIIVIANSRLVLTHFHIHKMVKHTQAIRLLLPMNCMSVFDDFVGLALKGLKQLYT